MRLPIPGMQRRAAVALAFLLFVAASLSLASAQSMPPLHRGYYTAPAIHGDTLVFTAEGDLWTVGAQGGIAHRLTSDPGRETNAVISPDGKTVAFSGDSEGPTEVYTIPIDGGLPQRITWDGNARPVGFAPDGRIMVSTARYSDLPGTEVVLIDNKGVRQIIPLAQAAQAVYDASGKSLFFTRWFSQPSHTKRYKGGTAESIWRYDGTGEAVPLTADYTGTSTNPLFWNGLVYFISDRDGVRNIYSMAPDGKDVKELSHQHIFDVESAALHNGRLVYACAGDLWLLDLHTGHEQQLPVTLQSDFDQMRVHWVKKPLEYLTSVHLSPDGSRAVFTARGAVFSIPAKTGRIIQIANESGVRYRDARFLPDGKAILALSTATGETEFWNFPGNGVGKPTQLTSDDHVLRTGGLPSPDGVWLAHTDKDQRLWLYNFKTKVNKQIAQSRNGGFTNLSWSPDSRWLAYAESANNQFDQIKILNVASGEIHAITSDRYNSDDPAWSSDGKWLYFLSDRMLKTAVRSPWGPRQPDPYFNHTMKIYELALLPGLRSPFLPADELHPDTPDKSDDSKPSDNDKSNSSGKSSEKEKSTDKDKDKSKEAKKIPEVKIDFTALETRLEDVPASAGNYGSLQATAKRLCWLSAADESEEHAALQCLAIDNKGDKPDTVLSGVRSFEVSLDRKKLLVRQKDDFYVLDASIKTADPKALEKAKIDLSHWTWATTPRSEYHGIFLDAWRLERDYFYDRHMQGVDWVAMRDRYLPLVDRVADRNELNDVIAQMVSELSALHTFVVGGDARGPDDHIDLASLGARLQRDEKAGGYVVEHIYAHDPDLPDQAPPLARPESLVKEGEVITTIDGTPTLSVPDARELLRGKAGIQVLLQVKSAKGDTREVLVKPVSAREDADLRYNEWEYTRRLQVDHDSHDAIGYVHLRAMGPNDIDQWARDFYPVFNRQGLIIDVRHNNGGNIDSWLLGKLLRKAWFYFQPRVGNPSWNMQDAFRGHIIVLCDQHTASDGEAFTAGFQHFQLGKVIGMRTWGGEIWLSFNNMQLDNGIASAAQLGVYTPDEKWLIEGHGVDPDIVVDNLPHATFTGDDAQLQAAIHLLQQEIKEDPRPVPPHPPYPDKAFHYQQ
ncbi:MAG TPA: S41 family peptidase [Terracidiphilus sp.]|nr:S41 family peptidase [Terracidiphilus sp.]